MRNTTLLFLLILVASCKSDSNTKNKESVIENLENKKQDMIEKASKKIVLLDCKDYFKNADYSTVCFIDGNANDYTVESSTDLGCVFRFAKVKNLDEYLDVNLTTYKNQKDSKAMYEIVLMEMSNNLEKIDGLGDVASLEKTDNISSNRSLYIKYNNSFIQVQANRVVGTRTTPCYYSKEEMIKFARLFISEL